MAYIIAEIGEIIMEIFFGKQLIEQAKFVGADAVKFQTWILNIIEKNASKANTKKLIIPIQKVNMKC